MLNLITIQGRLTADPEFKNISSGTPLVNITLACDRPKSRSGDKITDFIPCIAWSKTAELISKYCKKGDQIVIAGRFQSRNYETNDGTKRVAYEISISEVNFCGGKITSQNTPESTAACEDEDYINWEEIPLIQAE